MTSEAVVLSDHVREEIDRWVARFPEGKHPLSRHRGIACRPA